MNNSIVLHLRNKKGKLPIDDKLTVHRTGGIIRRTTNAGSYSGGVYFYKMETKGYSETRKLVLLK
ncbi:MAG: hypothetical protein M3R36_03480 [Bacteroidota bacterium]|nr:hypothetical protein [Bacteroidota bacterium]